MLSIGSFNAKATSVVVDFDDLVGPLTLTDSGYAGLTWETGNAGRDGLYPGEWIIDYAGSSDWLNSPPNNVVNGFGATLMGIGFSSTVDVAGAYFAGQGAEEGWTSGIRVHGYLESALVATTSWFNDIDSTPDLFAINLYNVDRIVIESVPVLDGGGYYNMDNLEFVVSPEPATLLLFSFGSVLLVRRRGKTD